MKLPLGLDFSYSIHGLDGRIQVDVLTFGTEAIYKLMNKFGQ